jgi:DNA-binding response OmpR family regulator
LADNGKAVRVLLAEDEAAVSALLIDQLKEMSCEIVGPARRVAHAASIIATSPVDAAIVDLNLHGESASELVRQLQALGVPVLVVSAYDAGYLRKQVLNVPFLEKPFGTDEFIIEVERLLLKAAERREGPQTARELSSE